MPRIIDLFPAHNDTSPVSGDALALDPNKRLRIMEPVGKKQELKFQCFRGPGCTACSRSPVLRAATEAVRGMDERKGTIKDNVANLLSSQERQAPITTYRAVEPLPEGIDKDGNAAVLLVVMPGPNHVDSETWVATTLRQMGWKGYIVFEVAVRCGTGEASDKHIQACAPYLVHTLKQTKAKRVMVCGTPASKAMTGNTMHPWNYGSWTHVPAPDNEDGTPDPERILVVSCPDPAEAWRNKFIAKFFRRAALMAMKMEVPEGLPDIKGRVVETAKDFAAFKTWVQDVPWLSYDVEWTGTPHNADFNFVCCAFSHPDYDTTWIFHDVLGVEDVHNYLRDLLQTKPIVAQNVAAEFVATQLHFGVEIGHVEGDTMLAFKLLNVDSKAALEDLAYYIGYNSHKAEMNAEMEKHKVAAQARVSTKVGGASFKGYIMDLIDPDILLRYNALDTHITGELHVEALRRLKSNNTSYLHDTFREFTIPATRLLHRIHCNGMRVDKKLLGLSREALGSSVRDIENQLRAHDLQTPSAVAAVRNHLIEHGMFDRLVADHGHNETKMQRFLSGANNTLSTDKYTLKAMKDYGDVPKLILEWREMMKLFASYGDTLGTYVRDDGRVHPSYRLDGARTGRLCVHQDTKVLTNFGEIAIKDLRAYLNKDTILTTLTHTGTWTPISAVFLKGSEEMYRVETEDGKFVVCTAGHRFWNGSAWVACRDLAPGDSLQVHDYAPQAGGVGLGRARWRSQAGAHHPQSRGGHQVLGRPHSVGADVLQARPSQPQSVDRECAVLVYRPRAGGAYRESTLRAAVRAFLRDRAPGHGPGAAARADGGYHRPVGTAHVRLGAVAQASHHNGQGAQHPRGSQDHTRPPQAAAQAGKHRWTDASGHGVAGPRGRSGTGHRSLSRRPDGVLPQGVLGVPRADGSGAQHSGARSGRVLRGRRGGESIHVHGGVQSQHGGGPLGCGPDCVRGHRAHQAVEGARLTASRGLRVAGGQALRGSGWVNPPQLPSGHSGRHSQKCMGSGAWLDPDARGQRADAEGPNHGGAAHSGGARPPHRAATAVVSRVIPVGVHDVWDLTVPGDHSYTAQGLVHHNSVNSPNTTQIPKHGKHSAFIKNCFCANHGSALVAFDYKTLEVFVAAIISGDLIMQEACRSADFHLETAKKMAPYAWNCTPEEVEHEVLVKKDKTKRTAAKGITFSVLYGAGPHSLADTLNCSFEQADMLMKSYAQAYPTFAAWVRATHLFAQENGYVHIPWDGKPARLRPLIGAGFAKFGGDGARFSQAMRQSQNSPPQGMAAQYAIMASIDLEAQFRGQFDPKTRPKVIAMVHDSIIVETPQKYMDEVIPRMYHAMTSLPTGCDLRLQVDAEVGETWGTLESIDLKKHVGAES